MCLIQSPHNPSILALQHHQAGRTDKQHHWCHNAATGQYATRDSHCITANTLNAKMQLNHCTHFHPLSTDVEINEHHHHTGQSWILNPKTNQLELLPHRDLCLAVEPSGAEYRPCIKTCRVAEKIMPRGWTATMD